MNTRQTLVASALGAAFAIALGSAHAQSGVGNASAQESQAGSTGAAGSTAAPVSGNTGAPVTSSSGAPVTSSSTGTTAPSSTTPAYNSTPYNSATGSTYGNSPNANAPASGTSRPARADRN